MTHHKQLLFLFLHAALGILFFSFINLFSHAHNSKQMIEINFRNASSMFSACNYEDVTFFNANCPLALMTTIIPLNLLT